MADFYIALKRTRGFEGGFSDNPNDSGGRTIHGISEKWFPEAWEDGPPDSNKCTEIYRMHFWLPLRCNLIDSQNIANELFDTAVNIGLHKAVLMLQESVNALGHDRLSNLVLDGRMGPQTIDATNRRAREYERALFNFMNFLQAQHYVDIGSTEFLRGWFAHRIGGWVDYDS